MKRQTAKRVAEPWPYEAQFRALMEASPSIVHFKDAEGRYVAVNSAFEAMLGLPSEEILGKTAWELPVIARTFVERMVTLDEEVLRTGKSLQIRSQPPVASWKNTVTHLVKFPVMGPGGAVEGIGTIETDVTEQDRTVEELRETSRRLELAQRQAKVGYWRWSFAKQRLTHWSQEAARISQYPLEAGTKDYGEVLAPIHPDDRDRVEAEFAAADSEKRDFSVDYRVIQKDGQITHIREVGEVEYDNAGEPVGHVGFVQDITELKKAEETAERLVAAIDNLTESVALYDRDDRLLFGNKLFWEQNAAVRDIVGLGDRYEDILKAMIARGLQPEAEGREAEWLETRLAQHRDPAAPVEIRRQDGLIIQLLEQRLPDGGIASLATDISRYKTIEADLLTAKEEAEVANRTKTDFLANMSHELRTPLNSIIGFSQILAEETFGPLGNPKYMEYARDIGGSGDHLLALISDILDISKIEARQVEIDAERIPVGQIFRECQRMVSERADAGRIAISSEVAGDIPDLDADRRLIMQILLNLLSNSVKFTPAGGQILMRARLDENGGIVFQVVDTGIGIADDDIPNITQPFVQAGRANAMHSQGGTGLGLSLVKSLTELHGGRFTIRSKRGLGTRMTVTFPPERSLPGQAGKAPHS